VRLGRRRQRDFFPLLRFFPPPLPQSPAGSDARVTEEGGPIIFRKATKRPRSFYFPPRSFTFPLVVGKLRTSEEQDSPGFSPFFPPMFVIPRKGTRCICVRPPPPSPVECATLSRGRKSVGFSFFLPLFFFPPLPQVYEPPWTSTLRAFTEYVPNFESPRSSFHFSFRAQQQPETLLPSPFLY